MSTTKQKSSAGKNVLIFFIVFIILEMLIILGVGRIFKNKDVTPSIAGYSLYLMDSKEMGDKVPQGSLVIAANGLPSVDKVGQAVLCEKVEGIGTSVFWLQDVVSSGEGKDGVIYRVYQGDNPSKIYEVSSANVIGMASTYYTTAGDVINFLKSNFGIFVCAAIPVILLVVIEIIIAIATHSPKKDETDEEEETQSQDVQLDDFLFGGKNEGEQIERHRKKMEMEIAEHHKNDSENEDEITDENSQEEYAQSEKSEPVVAEQDDDIEEEEKEQEEQPEAAPASAEIDRSYYEKASQLVDGGKTKFENASEMPAAEDAKSAEKVSKTAQSSLEDLMKLMEIEQNKLKQQLDKKD